MANNIFKMPSFNTDSSKVKVFLILAFPFILMDFFIRMLAKGVNYHLNTIVFPNILFTILWIFLIVCISLCLKGKSGKIFYSVCFAFLFILFTANLVYYPYTGFFFSFNLLQSAEEGSAYVWDTIKKAGVLTHLSCFAVLASGIFAIIKFPKINFNRWKSLIVILIVFTSLRLTTPVFLGQANSSLKWDNWRNPRNVYENFSDCNKNMKICGFFEYTLRDFYVTFLRSENKQDPEELDFLKDEYSQRTLHLPNEYTGIFEGKNVIFLQLEGMDSWLLNSVDTPNLYSMLDNSLIFSNHYSYYTGGGSTFNSELAVTTGFLTPFSYTQNPYSFNNNFYPGSLPNQMKRHGYVSNAFHMNSGEYYMRDLNYKNWGYKNYYSLMDDGKYDDLSYQLDRELIKNEFFYEKMFKQDGPFLNYIISYTPHTPFTLDSKMGKLLADTVYGENGAVPNMDEEEVARFFASETDYMVSLLLEALNDNGLLENTIIVAFADHYLYTINDKSVLDKHKNTSNNLINQTPFFIWSHGMKKQYVNKVNSQLDILPTVLNMLGVEYIEQYYIGNDIMDDSYTGYAFFSDYSWYDGVNYVEYGEVTNNPYADPNYISQTNTVINNLIRRNDLTLKYNYFKRIKDKH